MSDPKKPINTNGMCIWGYQGDEYNYYETDCGHAFIVEEGTLAENQMRFCFYCGKSILPVYPKEDPWPEDPLERMNEHE